MSSVIQELKQGLISEFSSANGKSAVDRLEMLMMEIAKSQIEALVPAPLRGIVDVPATAGEKAVVAFTNEELDKLAANAAAAQQAADAAAKQAQQAQAALTAAKAATAKK